MKSTAPNSVPSPGIVPPVLEFNLLRVGSCRHREAVAMRGAPWRLVDFPALCGVFRHPRLGVILYDTGYSNAFFTATKPFPERFFRWMTPVQLPAGEQLVTQLAALGIATGDVALVLISHFHADHVAGLQLFPHARLMCMRADWEWFRDIGRVKGISKGFLRALLPGDIAERLEFAEDAAEVPADGLPAGLGLLSQLGAARDILGDGSLIAVPLPGHSACQMGLLLQRDAAPIFGDYSATTFFVADAAWSIQALRENRPPSRFAHSIVQSVEAFDRTFALLCQIAQRKDPEQVPFIIASHCTATFNEWTARRAGKGTASSGGAEGTCAS